MSALELWGDDRGDHTMELTVDTPSPATAAPSTQGRTTTTYDVEGIRREFPTLHQSVHDRPLVYLDNAATAQTPLAVIEAIDHFYRVDCSNIHRGVHTLSARATRAYEEARAKVAAFINAPRAEDLVFVRGTTEALNLVANTWGRENVGPGDEVVLTALEHHSNIVPWQMLRDRTGCALKVADITSDGEVDLESFRALLGPKTKLVALAHVSNALGTINPVREMIAMAHEVGAVVVVDGAQAVPHLPVDVQELDCDFYAFSGHKLYGPMGIGALYGKSALLRAMPPFEGGGGMIRRVTFEQTTYAPPPERFEAGTPNVVGAIGLGAAVTYLEGIGMSRVHAYEEELARYAEDALAQIPGLKIFGPREGRAAVFSMVLDPIHPHDLGTILDQDGVAVRAGHHCAQPLMQRLGVVATVRASLGIYNTRADIDALVRGLQRARTVFGLN